MAFFSGIGGKMDWCRLNEIQLVLLQMAFQKHGEISLCRGKSLLESFQPNYEETKILFYFNDKSGSTRVVEGKLE